MALAARSGLVQFARGGSTPDDSAGLATPVGEPKPKDSSAACRRSDPRDCAILIVPTFELWARICSTVMACVAWASWSVKVRS
jgi:hypothetical protein